MDGASTASTPESHEEQSCWLQGAEKLETKKCAPQFLEIHCPGHAGGSELVVQGYEVFPMSRSVPPCLSQLQLQQEGIAPK